MLKEKITSFLGKNTHHKTSTWRFEHFKRDEVNSSLVIYRPIDTGTRTIKPGRFNYVGLLEALHQFSYLGRHKDYRLNIDNVDLSRKMEGAVGARFFNPAYLSEDKNTIHFAFILKALADHCSRPNLIGFYEDWNMKVDGFEDQLKRLSNRSLVNLSKFKDLSKTSLIIPKKETELEEEFIYHGHGKTYSQIWKSESRKENIVGKKYVSFHLFTEPYTPPMKNEESPVEEDPNEYGITGIRINKRKKMITLNLSEVSYSSVSK